MISFAVGIALGTAFAPLWMKLYGMAKKMLITSIEESQAQSKQHK